MFFVFFFVCTENPQRTIATVTEKKAFSQLGDPGCFKQPPGCNNPQTQMLGPLSDQPIFLSPKVGSMGKHQSGLELEARTAPLLFHLAMKQSLINTSVSPMGSTPWAKNRGSQKDSITQHPAKLTGFLWKLETTGSDLCALGSSRIENGTSRFISNGHQ